MIRTMRSLCSAMATVDARGILRLWGNGGLGTAEFSPRLGVRRGIMTLMRSFPRRNVWSQVVILRAGRSRLRFRAVHPRSTVRVDGISGGYTDVVFLVPCLGLGSQSVGQGGRAGVKECVRLASTGEERILADLPEEGTHSFLLEGDCWKGTTTGWMKGSSEAKPES